jgi:hypothetical protein
MLGLVFGTICVVGLVKVLRRVHGGHFCRYGGNFYNHGGRRRLGGRWMLRSLFERLDTTPGQEKAIVSALDRLREERHLVREEMMETRAAMARVVQDGLVDDASFDDTFARHDRVLSQVRVSLVEAVKTVVEALDERQRKELGALLTGRFFARRGFDGSNGVWA